MGAGMVWANATAGVVARLMTQVTVRVLAMGESLTAVLMGNAHCLKRSMHNDAHQVLALPVLAPGYINNGSRINSTNPSQFKVAAVSSSRFPCW